MKSKLNHKNDKMNTVKLSRIYKSSFLRNKNGDRCRGEHTLDVTFFYVSKYISYKRSHVCKPGSITFYV